MNLIVAMTGASGALATKLLLEKSQWPVTLVASKMGRVVYEQEVGPFADLEALAAEIWKDADLTATIASGSVPTVGMVILPCSANTLGKVACGIADSLVTRAAHCQLKEGRKVVLCVRESPWTAINAQNAATVALAGGTIMPISPPYYMAKGRDPNDVSIAEMLGYYVDHVLSLFGQSAPRTWEDIR
ncbi:MAG: UbiX family flavin prenyltransferase [Kiritimatiellales bacterium]|nr:UbiX family flavin prenyltransferase [Kiritimatiellales bacterium]MCF7864407.1 UbiX family flavin prenyltransferase [Kiritimatiellales bacterium]